MLSFLILLIPEWTNHSVLDDEIAKSASHRANHSVLAFYSVGSPEATLASPFFFDQPNDVFSIRKSIHRKNSWKTEVVFFSSIESFAVHITLPETETNITPETVVGFGVGRGFLPGAMFVLGSVMFWCFLGGVSQTTDSFQTIFLGPQFRQDPLTSRFPPPFFLETSGAEEFPGKNRFDQQENWWKSEELWKSEEKTQKTGENA